MIATHPMLSGLKRASLVVSTETPTAFTTTEVALVAIASVAIALFALTTLRCRTQLCRVTADLQVTAATENVMRAVCLDL